MNKNKIIFSLLAILAFASFVSIAKADGVSLSVTPASAAKTVGDNIELSVAVSASPSKVYAVEGKLVLTNLTCKSISLSAGVTPQSSPTCDNPYFLLGIPAGATDGKVLMTVSTVANGEGTASVSFADVDIVGEGVSLSKVSTGGNYTIGAKTVAPTPTAVKATAVPAKTTANPVKPTKAVEEVTAPTLEQQVPLEAEAVVNTAATVEGSSWFSGGFWVWAVIVILLLGIVMFAVRKRNHHSESKMEVNQ